MAGEPDPYDIASLQTSLNDSATRVSTIWVSFILFGLYLIVAAGSVSHKQLLFEESLKLPALGTEVPLFWFFTLSPVLFVLLHLYILLQVLLLGRTAYAYDNAVNVGVHVRSANAIFRQRLANTLFAQMFAGSPRERGGLLGAILRLIAGITLVVGPVCVVLVFQYSFLPYHSSAATWAHRGLVLVELAAAVVLWPVATNPRRELSWYSIKQRMKWRFRVFGRLIEPGNGRSIAIVLRRTMPLLAPALVVLLSVFVLSFPGEEHINVATRGETGAVVCNRWLPDGIDSLRLRGVNVIDKNKVDHLAQRAANLKPWEGERIRSFAGRDFSCADFDLSDFRHTSFEGANLTRAKLNSAQLEGVDMRRIIADGAEFSHAQLKGAGFTEARLRNANFKSAHLEGADFFKAHLETADFSLSVLNGADLGGKDTLLYGAIFQDAELFGAKLGGAQLWAANLQRAKLHAARLGGTNLTGANLRDAQLIAADMTAAILVGATLEQTHLQGAILEGANFEFARVDAALVWRARHFDCSRALVTRLQFDPQIVLPRTTTKGAIKPAVPSGKFTDRLSKDDQDIVPADKKNRETLVKLVEGRLPKESEEAYEESHKLLQDGLELEDQKIAEATQKTKASCTEVGISSSTWLKFDQQLGEFLGDRVCEIKREKGADEVNARARESRKEEKMRYVAAGLIANAEVRDVLASDYFKSLGAKLLDCMPLGFQVVDFEKIREHVKN